jgi:hypothetical protein
MVVLIMATATTANKLRARIDRVGFFVVVEVFISISTNIETP